MTDKELLELAAKAAGVLLIRSRLDDQLHKDMLASNSARNPHHESGPWNPLQDDGDAMRVAVKLGIGILYVEITGEAEVRCNNGTFTYCEYGPDDPYAAARRAIVRAAAEIGKSMKG